MGVGGRLVLDVRVRDVNIYRGGVLTVRQVGNIYIYIYILVLLLIGGVSVSVSVGVVGQY